MMPASSIVTGAAGFIGSHLSAALLRRGVAVVGVDNFDPFYDRTAKVANIAPLQCDGFELVEADIRDGEAMCRLFDRVRPISVFHIAALAGVRPSIQEPARVVAVNVEGLVNVLEAARRCGCRRFVFASSSSVYGNPEKVGPFSEDDPVDQPISPYAATKRAGEVLCYTYSRLYEMVIACVRMFTVYGPAQRPDLAIGKFMRLIADGRPVPMFGDGGSSRDYTYIDDIIHGVLAAHDRIQASNLSASGGQASNHFRIWNLGGSKPVALRRMIEAIGSVVGKTPRIEQLHMQPGDVQRTWADLGRSRAELGYEPKTSFGDGLRRQWVWMREIMAKARV